MPLENDDVNDELMTEEQLSRRYTNCRSVDAEGGEVGGDQVDDGLRQVLQSCVKTLCIDFKGEFEPNTIEDLVRLHVLTAKNLDFCSKRPRRVWIHAQTAERVDNLERKIASGFAGLEARIDAKIAPSGMDIAVAESSETDKVMRKFNEEYQRKREEDKHTIKNDESMNTLLKKLELDFLGSKERKEGSAASTAAASSGSGCSGRFNTEVCLVQCVW